MPDATKSTSRRTLNGWKEIAAYLGKSVRSVQRWEATLGLPVHRIKTPDGQIVYAEVDEIDAWRQALDVAPVQEPVDSSGPQPHPESRPDAVEPPTAVDRVEKSPVRGSRAWLIAASVVIIVAAAAWARREATSHPAPVDFRFRARALEALNLDGSVLWTHRFDRDVRANTQRGPRLGFQWMDVDIDNEPDILAFVQFAQEGRPSTISDGLFCFERDGTLKWSVIPDHTLSFGDERYSAPWKILDFVASDTPGPRRLWIAVAHHTWWPSFVLEIDGKGTAHVRYVQAGRIFSLAHWVTPAGGVLAVGGVTNERQEATLALLQDGDPPASFPGHGSGAYECANCPDGRPRRVLAFASSLHSGLFPERHPFVNNLTVSGVELKVNLDEALRPPGTHAIAIVGPNQELRSLGFGDSYWRIHRQLEQAQRIHHTVDECPDRRRDRIVREWTPSGWRELHVEGEPSAE